MAGLQHQGSITPDLIHKKAPETDRLKCKSYLIFQFNNMWNRINQAELSMHTHSKALGRRQSFLDARRCNAAGMMLGKSR
jgi:hypothetical protein